ncbi:hypothetical protein HTY53_24545 [Cupriavidus gilardii]|nr:hypothetical protein [Cupriavidus gilardii]
MDNLTPEQALRLGDALSNMIPYFGSPAMLYQAVTGRTLSAQPLETVDRWLSGILGAIPVGAAAYGKLSQLLGRGAGAVDPEALNALVANGVKFTREHVVATTRTPSGQVVFLETGSTTAGLRHIIQEHAKDFANIGVTESQIPGVVMSAIKEGLIVGYQGTGTGRPIYQTVVNGQKQNIAITIGSNGFVVGANPAGRIK